MYTIFRCSSSQYSRRLLSILAQQTSHQIRTKQCCLLTTLNANNTRVRQQVFTTNLIRAKRKKKKYGAHTHVHHLSCTLFSIFTSVVVYSRTSQSSTNKKSKTGSLRCLTTCLCLIINNIFSTLAQLCDIKKNVEHTRMYTIFRYSSSQYSRRLLSILAQYEQYKKQI